VGMITGFGNCLLEYDAATFAAIMNASNARNMRAIQNANAAPAPTAEEIAARKHFASLGEVGAASMAKKLIAARRYVGVKRQYEGAEQAVCHG